MRLKLTFSYAGFLMLAGSLLIDAGWVLLLRYAPDSAILEAGGLVPSNLLFQGDVLTVLRILRGAFLPAASIMLLFLLGFGLLGGWFLAGQMLAPLAAITEATRKAASGSLSHRIQLQGRDDEFRELADSFDTMLARIEAHVAEQQRFAANASHELRTPLATTRTLLEVARNDQNCDTRDLVERLSAVNNRAIALTEALLLLSRADQRAFTSENVDLSLIVEEAVETLLPLAEKHGVTIEMSSGASPTSGSQALLLQMTLNLVHNAIIHNRPEWGTVHVSTSCQSDGVRISIENTGEMLTPQVVSTLTEPFQRGTERIRGDQAGVGLGLAIVKSVVQAHDGALSIVPRDTGGLSVAVQLAGAREPGRREAQDSRSLNQKPDLRVPRPLKPIGGHRIRA